MNKSQQILRKELFGHKSALLGGVLVVLALFVTTRATAAPATASKAKSITRVTTTTVDPLLLRPTWTLGSTTIRSVAAPRAGTTVGQRLGVFSAQGNTPLVNVPARPQPRSPFLPPAQGGR